MPAQSAPPTEPRGDRHRAYARFAELPVGTALTAASAVIVTLWALAALLAGPAASLLVLGLGIAVVGGAALAVGRASA
ncbi:hypothetical protein, partial [Enterococcus hirae]|uniref:hypothetical protein n=1 Tax=Enterococcus hirae TaxID=1354 RepID=UPI00136BDCC5